MTTPLRPVPSECTAFKLRRATRRSSRIYDAALAPYRLSIGQFGLLGQVIVLDGVNLTELAEQMGMDRSTLTRALDPLLREGLAVHELNPADRRQKRIRATTEGRIRFDEASVGWAKARADIIAVLGESRVRALSELLEETLGLL